MELLNHEKQIIGNDRTYFNEYILNEYDLKNIF